MDTWLSLLSGEVCNLIIFRPKILFFIYIKVLSISYASSYSTERCSAPICCESSSPATDPAPVSSQTMFITTLIPDRTGERGRWGKGEVLVVSLWKTCRFVLLIFCHLDLKLGTCLNGTYQINQCFFTNINLSTCAVMPIFHTHFLASENALFTNLLIAAWFHVFTNPISLFYSSFPSP